MKASIRKLATGRDNTDTVIHSAVDGGCMTDGSGRLPGWFWDELVGEGDFKTDFDIPVRRRCPCSIIAGSFCFALLGISQVSRNSPK